MARVAGEIGWRQALPLAEYPAETVRACGASQGRGKAPSPHNLISTSSLLREGFLVNYIRHLANVAAVVPFQHVNQSLDAASSHAFIGIGRQARDARSAGKGRQKAAAIGD